MGFWDIFSIIDKWLPGRIEVKKNRVIWIKNRLKEMTGKDEKINVDDLIEYSRLTNELSRLETELQNAAK